MLFLPKNRIWIFAGLSAAVHVAIISDLPMLAGDRAPPTLPTVPIVAQLMPTVPLRPPTPKAPIAPAPRRIAPPAAPVAQPVAPPVESPQSTIAAAPELANETPEPVTEPPINELPADPAPVAEAVQEAQPGAAASSPASSKPQPVRDLPQNGSIRYEVFIGSDKLSIGRTVQTWTIEKESYRLTSYSETTGLAGFFRPYQLGYVSEGRVDAAGLKPETFSARRGRTGARQLAAHFDWASGELTLGPINAQRKAALPSGTLDLISFIYQLARADLAPGHLRLSITNGNKVDTYTLEVGAEEMLELPLGMTRAVPVRQVRTPGQESMEIWFAPEQSFLPVRIRFLDRNGNMSGEQVANEITADVR